MWRFPKSFGYPQFSKSFDPGQLGRQLRGRGSAQAVPEEVHGGRRPWGLGDGSIYIYINII